MFSRIKNTSPSLLPEELINAINSIINDSFGEQFSNKNLMLSSYGEMYENEIVLILSLIGHLNDTSISLFMSDEIDEKTNLKDKIDQLVNSSSEFFEKFIHGTDEEILDMYTSDWQKADFPAADFYYKISRENIQLTIQANKLLGENDF